MKIYSIVISIGFSALIFGCNENARQNRNGHPIDENPKFDFSFTCKETNCKLEIVSDKDGPRPLLSEIQSTPEIKKSGIFHLATISCGNPCSATYILNSENGDSFGPLSDVLLLEPLQMTVAWLEGNKVVVTNLKTGDKLIEFVLPELAPVAASVSAIESTWNDNGQYWVRYLKGNNFGPMTVQVTQEKSETLSWNLKYRGKNQSHPILVDLDADGQLDTARIVSFAGRPPAPYIVSNPFGWNPHIPDSNRLAIEVALTGTKELRHLLADSSLFNTPIYADSLQWASLIRAGTSYGEGTSRGMILVGTETGADFQLWYQNGKFHITAPRDAD